MTAPIITIEGLDGCGKSAVCQELKWLHPEWYFTREPNDTTLHSKLARARLQGDNTYPPYALLHLMALASHEEFAATAKFKGDAQLCITERCAAISSLVYQQSHFDLPVLLALVSHLPQPAGAVLIRVDPDVACERRHLRDMEAEMFETVQQTTFARHYDEIFGLTKSDLLMHYRAARRFLVVNGHLSFGRVVELTERALLSFVTS